MNTLSEHRFQLAKGSRKHRCPECKRKSFKLYLDTETEQPLDPAVGRCDHAESCGHHFAPREYFRQTGTRPDSWKAPAAPKIKPKPERPGRLPFGMMQQTLNRYDENQLVKWMANLPGWNAAKAEQTAKRYHVGTGNKQVNGWPIFWQVDDKGEVRSGKLIKYNPATGKRIKDDDVYSYDWIHRILIRSGMLPDDETRWKLDQCLFGLHLIDTDKNKPIAIVESEKTALLASQYVPDLLWMAAGALHGLQTHKMEPLKGRDVLLFPDKGKAFHKWKEQAEQLKALIPSIKVSDLLERKAPDEHDGYDIADYLIQYSISSGEQSAPYGFNTYTGEIFDQRGYPADWDDVTLPEPGTDEHADIFKAELSDQVISEHEYLKGTDAIAAKIISLFDAVPDYNKSRAYME